VKYDDPIMRGLPGNWQSYRNGGYAPNDCIHPLSTVIVNGYNSGMNITDLFTDTQLAFKIQVRLPQLFQLAELESSRAGRVGMEVGSARERILIALLIHKFGKANVETDIPITEAEVDVRVFGKPISIKTVTGKKLGGVKIIWTVDPEQALRFSQHYEPTRDVLLAQVNWGNTGGFFLFPKSAQFGVLK
jgi:hypothetical protein